MATGPLTSKSAGSSNTLCACSAIFPISEPISQLVPNYFQLVAHSTFLSSFCADIIATRAQASGDQEKIFHHKPSAQSSMDHAIPKLTLRRFKTRFSCSFLLQLLASCASERVQHHGAHPWVRGKLKQKRPKAILKNRHFLIKGVVGLNSPHDPVLSINQCRKKSANSPYDFNHSRA